MNNTLFEYKNTLEKWKEVRKDLIPPVVPQNKISGVIDRRLYKSDEIIRKCKELHSQGRGYSDYLLDTDGKVAEALLSFFMDNPEKVNVKCIPGRRTSFDEWYVKSKNNISFPLKNKSETKMIWKISTISECAQSILQYVNHFVKKIKIVEDKVTAEEVPQITMLSPSIKFVKSVLSQMAHYHPVMISKDQLDADPLIVGLPGNQCFDIRTGKIRDRYINELITRQLNYHPNGKQERMGCSYQNSQFLKYIHTLAPDINDKRMLQCAIGSMLVGYNIGRKVIWVKSPTGSGKSVLVRILDLVAGEYIAEIEDKSILGKDSNSFTRESEMSRVNEMRGVIIDETDEHEPWKVKDIKRYTGQGKISSRKARQDTKIHNIKFNMTCFSNFEPNIETDDPALFDRLYLINLDSAKTIPQKHRDDLFAQKIVEKESDTIIAWMLKGAKMAVHRGLPPMPPKSVENVDSVILTSKLQFAASQSHNAKFIMDEFLKYILMQFKPASNTHMFPCLDLFKMFVEWSNTFKYDKLSLVKGQKAQKLFLTKIQKSIVKEKGYENVKIDLTKKKNWGRNGKIYEPCYIVSGLTSPKIVEIEV